MGELCAQFAGGSGTPEDPFKISNIEELQKVKQYLNAHFEIVNDIDASATAFWNEKKGFDPIGHKNSPFTGSLDGNGYKIVELTIKRDLEESVGLFGVIKDATIKNLHLKDILVHGANKTGSLLGNMLGGRLYEIRVRGIILGRTHTGGLVGFNRRGNIEFCTVSESEINGRSYVGGITGINRGRIIKNKFRGKISATGHNLGGIAGNNYDGLISESESEGTLAGEGVSSVGGIAGSNGSVILRSFSKAKVSGRSYVGGLVGNNHNGEISTSYSEGTVEGFNFVGGLAGVNRRNSIIRQSYTISPVSGVIDFGAYIGVNRDPVIAGYWNKETANHNKAVGKGIDTGIKGLCDAEMRGFSSFENMAGFSFGQDWGYKENEAPQHLWNMPYVVINKAETGDGHISGDEIIIEIIIQNIGNSADTNDVILLHPNGEEIDRAENIALEKEQQRQLTFSWQTLFDDHGTFELLAVIGDYKKPIPVRVSRIPDPVNPKQPFVLEEHVSLKPTFSWEDAFLAENYTLQISKDEDFKQISLEVPDIDTTFYQIDKPLKNLTYYYWRVQGTNSDTVGSWSDISEFITIIEKPETVQLKKPKAETKDASTQPVFSWAAANRAEDYQLQISADDEFESTLFDTTLAATDTVFAMATNLPEKRMLYWRMKAHNIGGESNWSEIWSFIPLIPPAKNNKFNRLDYTLEQNYPNPFNPVTYIRYSIPEPGKVLLDVLNMLGQTVATLVDDYKSAGWHTAVFDASELSSGFYIYRIKAKNFEATKKLSVVK
ncbi:MAG: GLUG motif-containing protein [Gracilimonas sp.]|nr:GLUG motif-containing protein [Gracilimonas sp.]